MSDTPDPSEFAAARATLRETVKWLVGVASAVGAALSAGISVTAFGSLTGDELLVALVFAVVALAALIVALAELLRVLLVQPFTERQLRADAGLCDRLADAGILPIGITNLQQLIDKREQAVAAVRAAPSDNAKASLAAWQRESRRALDYGAFLDLSNRTTNALRSLAMYSVVVVLCTGVIGWLLGNADATDKTDAGGADACATARLTALPGGEPQDGVELTLPNDCARDLLLRGLREP